MKASFINYDTNNLNTTELLKTMHDTFGRQFLFESKVNAFTVRPRKECSKKKNNVEGFCAYLINYFNNLRNVLEEHISSIQ